jgi:hypothetical protein
MLNKLAFSTGKAFGLRDAIDLTFGVMPGKPGKLADFKPGWVSLWTMADISDDQPLVERYGEDILTHLLPYLHRDRVLVPLTAITAKAFAATGYPLKDLEALHISKLMTRLLEMAAPRESVFDFMAEDIYNVSGTIRRVLAGETTAPQFPRWFNATLHAIARDTQLLHRPQNLLLPIYLDLLDDAIRHAFKLIKQTTGESMGEPDEIDSYARDLVERLRSRTPMDFTHTYMPLILGGIILNDRVFGEDEDIAESLRGMSDVLDERQEEIDDSNALIVDMLRDLVNRSLTKYGYNI